MSLNVCMSVTGLRNRYLPRQLALTAFVVAGGAIILGLVKFGVWDWRWILAGVAAQVPLTVAVCFSIGVPLARVAGWLCRPFAWWDDWKRQRVDLLLEFLGRKEHADLDVICIQECYDALVFPGGYPRLIAEGAAKLGFIHVARPSRLPDFPATLAQNSGLMILSKIPIVKTASRTFGFSVETFNVNRGVMHVQLEGGLNIFTCHITPGPTVASKWGKGVYAPSVLRARRTQARQLKEFVEKHAGACAPMILAGDLNLSISFKTEEGVKSFHGTPQPQPEASHILSLLRGCGLEEATFHIRGENSPVTPETELAHFRPTFGYTGEGGVPAERSITSIGDGSLHNSCDDAVLFRGVELSAVEELPVVIPLDRRPAPEVTHVTDHWAVRAYFIAPLSYSPHNENERKEA